MDEICLDIDLNHVCRICLSQTDMSEHLFHIFADAIVDGILVALPKLIEYCVDVQVGEDHEIPNKICQSCKTKMFEMYVFKQKCYRTDRVLRSMLKNITSMESDAFGNEDEDDNNSLQHLSTPVMDNSAATSTSLFSSESLLSMNNIEESIREDNRSDNHIETIREFGSPLGETNDLNDQDNVYSISNEEEYIEDVGEELPSSPTMSNATIDNLRPSEQIHVTITEIIANNSDCFACEICGITRASKARLKRHMKLHIDSNAVLGQMNFFSCTGCRTMYLNEEHLNEHSRVCTTFVLTADDYQAIDDSSLKPIHCGICDASYSNTVQLKQHIISHMERVSCPFEGCGCEYVSLARLNLHVSSKHVDYFSLNCPHCKEDIDRADLNQHLRLFCKAKQFKCSHCDKKFLSSRALAQHLKNLAQNFQCNQCDKSCSSRASLKLHQRTHTGERPFVCTVCNKSYKTASLRTAHMDSHIEGKTFECSICGKFLQTRISYRNHIKRHLEERTHECNICGKKFYAKYSLRVHQEMIHKIKRATGSDQVID